MSKTDSGKEETAKMSITNEQLWTEIKGVRDEVDKVKEGTSKLHTSVEVLRTDLKNHMDNEDRAKVKFRWTFGIILGIAVPFITTVMMVFAKLVFKI